MNNQDAIEMLKSMLPEKISYAELVGAVGCYGGGEYVYSDPEPYAIETAISALEKQIPKKPIEEQGITPRCHHCESANYLTNEDEEENSYCGNCGQAIDWRNEDE